MSDIRYYTAEGLKNLNDEYNYLTTKGRADMSAQISEARDKGDLSENAEYDAAKEAQGHMEARIVHLESQIANGRLLDESIVDTSRALILSTVRVMNLKFKKEFKYTLVSPSEADLKAGRISIDSPIGVGLKGSKVGDIVDIEVPAGVIQFEILEITR
ncbi:transcription elongation factor GreA [Chitinophagales bacterium]|nr:transcription elongation factor GreA [Chitinophagales bacterium]